MASDYDFEPRQAPSVFLKLTQQGDKTTFRLASSPYREPKVWKEGERKPLDPENTVKLTASQWAAMFRDPEYNVTEIFHWKVLDRDSGQAKIFSSTPGVYKSIKKYAEMEAWGDPTTYDFQVERTENPGPGYYQVTALPTKEPLTDKQQELIDAVDLPTRLPAARRLTEAQLDTIPEDSGESNQTQAKDLNIDDPKNKDIDIEDLGDEPINLDDIPF